MSISKQGRAALEAMDSNGGSIDNRLAGGGFKQKVFPPSTLHALARQGLAKPDQPDWTITEAGRNAISHPK